MTRRTASAPDCRRAARLRALLDRGAKAGFLVAGRRVSAAYATGFLAPHVPVDRLPELLALPLADYLAATGTTPGWGWATMVAKGEYASLVGIAILAGCSRALPAGDRPRVPLAAATSSTRRSARCWKSRSSRLPRRACSPPAIEDRHDRPPFTRILLATEHTEFDVGAERVALELARRCGVPLAAVLPIVTNPEYEVTDPALAPQRRAAAPPPRGEALRAAAAGRGGRARSVHPAGRGGLPGDRRRSARPPCRPHRRPPPRQAGLSRRAMVGEMVGNVVRARALQRPAGAARVPDVEHAGSSSPSTTRRRRRASSRRRSASPPAAACR